MRRFGLPLAIMACLALFAGQAHAGAKEDAEKHFRAGVALQKVDDFDAASLEFEASLRLFPTKSALFNLANCYKAMHRYADALSTLERLQRDHGHELEEPMLSAAQSLRNDLENLTARLSIEVEPAGAQVLIDGNLVGESPLPGPLRLNLGDHRIEARLEGYETARAVINLGPREQTAERFVLEPQAPAPAVAPVPESKPEPAPAPLPPPGTIDSGGTPYAPGGWVALGIGGALLTGAAVTGVWALVVDDDLAGACVDERCPSDRQGDIDKLNTLSTTTNVLLGVGLTTAAVGVVLLLLDDRSRGREAGNPVRTRPRVDVALNPGFAGANLSYGF